MNKSILWVYGAGLILTLIALLIAFIPTPTIANYFYMMLTPLLPVVLGFGFCVIYKGGFTSRILGSVGLLLFSFVFSLAATMLLFYLQRMSAATLDYTLSYPIFWRNFEFALIRSVLLAAIALGGNRWLRGKIKFHILALIAAAAVLIINIIADWGYLQMVFRTPAFSGHAAQVILNLIIGSGFIMLAAMLGHLMAEIKTKRLHLSGGARAWCIIVSCLMGISLIMNLILGGRSPAFQSYLLLPAVVGMILLSASYRIGFALTLLGAGMSVMFALTRIFPFIPTVTATYIGYALGGGINPMITWFVIARAWRAHPSSAGIYPQQYATAQQHPGYGAQWQTVQQSSASSGRWEAAGSLPDNSIRFREHLLPGKSKATAIVLLIFLGFFQVHAFYLRLLKTAWIKLGALVLGIAITIGGVSGLYRDNLLSEILGVAASVLFSLIIVWNIVDLIRIIAKPKQHFGRFMYYAPIGTADTTGEAAVAHDMIGAPIPAGTLETAGQYSAPPRSGGGSMGGKIFGLVISIGLIIGGLSGQMVLRGTDSSAALVVAGIIFLILDIISLATHGKKATQFDRVEAPPVPAPDGSQQPDEITSTPMPDGSQQPDETISIPMPDSHQQPDDTAAMPAGQSGNPDEPVILTPEAAATEISDTTELS